jgi:hypothetical protein
VLVEEVDGVEELVEVEVDVELEVIVEEVDELVEEDELEVIVCDPHFVPLKTAAMLVGPVIDIATGSAVLPLMLPPDQWLNVHEP